MTFAPPATRQPAPDQLTEFLLCEVIGRTRQPCGDGYHPQSRAAFDFRYVSFFDGDPSEMADLAPDEGGNPKILDQRWQFVRTTGRPIYMVCRYHGTEQTVKAEVPEHIKECRLKGLMDGKSEIVGSPTLDCE